MRTLQLYVTRELLKTFLLAAVGLTLVLSLCGTMSTVLRVEVPTATTVLYILWLIQPMVLAVTLPVSALFACAIVYGRLAADNEFDACRASGINIHRLLAPALGLSIFTALFAFAFSNYVIPKAAAGIASRVQYDISKFAFQALKTRGYFKREDKKKSEAQILHAGKVDLVQEGGHDVLLIHDGAFIELKGDELVRCGTVRQGRADFKTAPESGEPLVEAFLTDVRLVDLQDIQQARLYQEKTRPFGSRELPKVLFYDPKWSSLGDLLKYKNDPSQLPPLRPQLGEIRREVRESLFYRRLCGHFAASSGPLIIEDETQRYEIRAAGARMIEENFTPELRDVSVKCAWTEEKGRKRTRVYQAESATVRLQRNIANTRDIVLISLLGGVTFTDSAQPGRTFPHAALDLQPIAAPPSLLEDDQQYSDARLLGLGDIMNRKIRSRAQLQSAVKPLGLGPQIEKLRLKAVLDMLRQRHQIIGSLHSRLGLCASALVTIILAAALGIIFRNGQFLTAFAISFLPALAIVAMNMLGRRQAESIDPHLHVLGVGIIWAGILLLALVDLVVLKRYLRR
ncbi:MAG TPA: LptF/LptG family permease [Phycisphaerae bacterium]|nr:LptF/LptG family permease [Phycisphaerae bacterium]HRR85709.1 LptF/LptG family permease [Phycisphaerae bacterium]